MHIIDIVASPSLSSGTPITLPSSTPGTWKSVNDARKTDSVFRHSLEKVMVIEQNDGK